MPTNDIVAELGLVDPPGMVRTRVHHKVHYSDAAVAARKAEAAAMRHERKATGRRPPRRAAASTDADASPSEDAVALEFVDLHDEHIYVAPWHRWYAWDGKRWHEDSTGRVYELIRHLVRAKVAGGKAERSTANASFVAGVERLLRTDQRIVVLPEQLDADPWVLNTQSGIVDLRTGDVAPHDKAALCTRVTTSAVDDTQGAELWQEFLTGITQGDIELQFYLQRLAGYCATGVVPEDMLAYLFGIVGAGPNMLSFGRSQSADGFASALA